MMLTGAKGDAGLASAVTPASAAAFTGRSPADGVAAVRADQDRLIAQTEAYAKSRAERLRLAYRLAGLDPAAFVHADGDSLGGPLIEAKDPRALAAVLDVDEDFAERIQRAASDLAETRDLTAASTSLPLAAPTTGTTRASGFGVREDPFTGRPAFHPGLDFAGPMMTAIHATAPGIVSFTGVRNGYGNTVEIDHGHGLKTRYGHLAAILVNVGDHVALGQRIAAMGSTGRSTGPHLHYEVWVDGRPQNPQRFLEAGDNVHQATE
jgi:murein DD-endopeptidase MepM/ murein hydrolase activator NlpD